MTDKLMPNTITAIEAEEILRNKLNAYAGDGRRWGLAVVMLLEKAADYLLESLQVSDGMIALDNSFVTYKYLLDRDWQIEREQGGSARPKIPGPDPFDANPYVQKVNQYIFDQSICAVLDWLSRSDAYWIGFVSNRCDEDLIADFLSVTKFPHVRCIDPRSELRLKSLKDIGISPNFLVLDSMYKRVGGVVFHFLPLVEDADEQSAYFPIELGIVPLVEKHISADCSESESIIDWTQRRWAGQVFLILEELSDHPICNYASMPDIHQEKFIDRAELQNLANDLQERFSAIVRAELLNVFKAHGLIPLEGDVQPINTGRLMDNREEENTFKKVGDYWETSFQGKRTLLKNIAGAHYIAYLLAYPEHIFPILELVSAVRHHEIGRAGYLDQKSSPDDEILDSQSKQEIQARLQELVQERSRAEEDNDVGRLVEIDLETDQIQEMLESVIGLGGKSRKTNSQRDRARVNITRLIKSAIQRIGKDNPALSSYLASTIKTGYACQYSPLPSTSITWNL